MIREININSELVAWLPWSVQYFFFIGLAACALLVAVSYRWFFSDKGPRTNNKMDVEMAAVAIAFVGGIVGPLSLMSELHQPGRFLNFYLHFTPTSWMSIGSLFIPVISVVVVAYFLLLLRVKTKKENLPKLLKILHIGNFNAEKILNPLLVVAFFIAIAIFIYTGSEVFTIEARLMWHTLAFPILMFLTALIGISPFLQLLLYKETTNLKGLAKMQVISVVLLLVATIFWLFSNTPSSKKLVELMHLDERWIFLNLILGILFIGTTAFAISHINKKFSFKAILGQAVCALTLMWFIRWVWLMEVQLLPKFNSTLNTYHIPLGNYGIFSIITSIGVFIILTLLVFVLLNITEIYTIDSDKINQHASRVKFAEAENSDEERRKWIIKGSIGTVGLLFFGAGFSDATKKIIHTIKTGTSGRVTRDRINGNSLKPEGIINENKWNCNNEQYVAFTQCNGCWTQCGVRVRVDKEKNSVLRVDGNPYHPLSHNQHFSYTLPVSEAFLAMSGDKGIDNRSTACARGAALHEGIRSEHRILKPMKRIGPRGSGKWKSISFEQLLEEVVDGGDLFGEGHVEGLKAIYGPNVPMDTQHLSYGSKSNQLLATFSAGEGRHALMKRFALNAFGTINYGQHGSYCGLNYRSGSGALMDDLQKNSHVKPDWKYLEFGIFWGTSPAQAGNPFKRQGRQLATERIRDNFDYVVIDPSLPNSTTLATRNHDWLPIKPGTDNALAMAMIKYIIDHKLYNENYLIQPNERAAQNANEKNHTNATHLVVVKEGHPLFGQFLRQKFINPKNPNPEATMVLSTRDNSLHSAEALDPARLFGEKEINFSDGSKVMVKTSFSCLQDSANRFSLSEYSDQCGIEVDKISDLANKFTSHGRRAAVIAHGGMMSASGFYSAWGIMMLNALIGNLNHKGGVSISGGKFPDYSKGPRYNLATFPNSLKPGGLPIARSKKIYEDSEEYKKKLAEGKNPYPATAPWYPFAGGQLTEQLASALAGYPYSLKAWINCMANPIYGIAGSKAVLVDKLKDPKNIPLFISIDAYMNETTALADYIVPDTHNFESWGFTAPWAGVPFKASTARWPVVEPLVEKTKKGQPICLESFLIEVANAMSLPGFGKNAIPDMNGDTYPLNTAEDYYLRAAANIAFAGEKSIPKATGEDIELTGVYKIKPAIESTLKPEEQLKVCYLYSRGGRFAPYESGWKGDATGPQWKKPMQIWNEEVGKHRNAMTGEYFYGCPSFYPALFADGSTMESHYPKKEWPMQLISFKSNIISSSTIFLARLRTIRRSNIVAINPRDAEKFNVKHGETITIKTPSNTIKCQIALLDGVTPGVIAIEHGWGHKGFGATKQSLDGVAMPYDKTVGNGINLNDLGIKDPSRTAVESTWLDWATGASVRQGVPATILKG
jgi:tetrathionate reductase subunit A